MTVLTELKAGPRVVGAKQTRRAVNDGRALRVFLAKDADPNVTAPIEELCAQRQVSVEWADAMREVGAACGIAAGAAVAALVREGSPDRLPLFHAPIWFWQNNPRIILLK